MKKMFVSLTFLATSMTLSAQALEIPLWPDGAPNTNGLTGNEIEMENGRVGSVTDPMIYVYLPQHTQPTAAVIICPGGGYARLAMNHEGHEVAQWLNSLGIAGIVLKYRMPNEHSDVPLSDAQQALRIVRQNSKEWNIAPGKVGIAGFSAGGHLAATAATHFTDSITRPDFAILFYAVISMDPTISHAGSHKLLLGENPDKALINQFCNEKQVTPQTPPTALFLSDDDRTVSPRNSSDFYTALKQNNVPAALYIFPTGGHGWGMNASFEYHSQWKGLLEKWLETIQMK
ncbi:MAG: alpha/beta hydrolase [Dysgonamonadaceae bacterium]|jgi:acetyl esterase/lipase|nr:alpha/beta hydrolase [Dysgonamonadaceae bacterium]